MPLYKKKNPEVRKTNFGIFILFYLLPYQGISLLA